jgi:uncharacterized membrane protein YcaP (DUF421 family)
MIQEIIMTIIKSIISYLILLVLGRLMGRKMISRITFFDFLIGVTLGALAVRMSLGNESSLLMTIISAVVITSMALITDQLTMKSSLFRKIEEGKPIILIQKGKLLYENLSKAKISISKLLMLLRQKDVFDIEDVDYAIFENDGYLSVLLKPEKLSPTAGEMKISKPENGLSVDVIVDGKIIFENLKSSQHTKEWLLQQLQCQGVNRPDQVFYASVNKTGKLYVAAFHKGEAEGDFGSSGC